MSDPFPGSFNMIPVRLQSGRSRITFFCVTCLLVLSPQAVRADLVKLLNGGELRGKIVHSSDTKERIRLETLTGATVVIDRDQTQFVTMRSLTVEEYETRARQIADTAESHWELAEWCRQHGLSKQREVQLVRVTELAPDNDKAQTALGRVWNQGAWIDRDELMASRGYVKYKNKYITSQELEVIEKTTDELERERGWFQKVRVWHTWLKGESNDRRRKAIGELKELDDQNAAPAVIKFLGQDPSVDIRKLAVAVLIKISGGKAAVGLVKLALFDESEDVRSVALDGIGHEYTEHAQAAFIKALRSDYNAVVCRAATALGKMGDRNAVGPLIDALVTTHHYQVAMDVPNNMTYSFTTDGGFGSSSPSLPPGLMNAVRTGQVPPPIMAPPSDPPPKKLVTVNVEHFNSEVLGALGSLTQQNFGYDRRTWNLWWAAEKNAGGKLPKPARN